MPINRNWSRDELVVALNLYLKLPFGKLHSRTKEIIKSAELIGRTASSVVMSLNNFASVDPYHQNRGIRGLKGGANQVKPIFNEFIKNRDELIFESEKILAGFENTSIEKKYESELRDISDLKGESKVLALRTRVNQNVFRQIVLANYNTACAVTGIDNSDLLIASHIIPWNKNAKERLNPENGICLSFLYDRAFDNGYISISEKLELLISGQLKKQMKTDWYERFFKKYEGHEINQPKKYLPKKEFLQYHFEEVFKK